MDRWRNKLAVVTGASSGMGAAIVKDLIKENLTVVGLARRVELMIEIQKNLPEEHQTRFHPIKCDVTNEIDVKNAFEIIEQNLGGSVDILINNAGILRNGNLATMDSCLIKETIDTNIVGIVLCTREAFRIMKDKNINGHVIVLSSIAGKRIPNLGKEVPSVNIYSPTKFAVSTIAEIYRQEFGNLDTKIKVTEICPGLTNTALVPDFLLADERIARLQPEDIAKSVLFALSTPENVQICEIVINSLGDPF